MQKVKECYFKTKSLTHCSVFTDDICGLVGTGIIVNDCYELEVRLLHYKTVQTIADIWLVIVCKAMNSYKYIVIIHSVDFRSGFSPILENSS